MVARLSLFWDEECQYLVELSKDMDILPFFLSNGAKAKRKLAIDKGEGRNILC